jgi:hypothetical protein
LKFHLILFTFFTGNELYINEIAARLQNIFRSRSHTENDLRKITLLLMLNTDASFSRDLNGDFSICHLLNNFPQLTKCLFVNLVWQLKLEKYFYEAIRYTPSWFMLQFLDEAVDSLRFSKPFEAIEQVKEIVAAIYFNVCRTDFKVTNASQQIELKIILNKLFDHIMSLLRNYNTPNIDDAITKSKNKLSEYLGQSMNHQLSLIQQCFELFQLKPQFQITEEFHIFKLMNEKEPEMDNHSANSYSPTVFDALTKTNIALLNTLQNSVMNITLDDFMYWVEIDIEDPSTEDEDLKKDNLQKSIGAFSYTLIQIINSNECFQHDVTKQLETLAIKPKTLAEIAKEATVGTVLEKIESSCSKQVWLQELLRRGDTLYCNTECLQTVIDNIDIMQFKDLMKILVEHQNHDDMDREDELQVKEILRFGGERLNNREIRDFTEEMIRVFGVDYRLNEDEAAYASELTNYLNKLTENDLDEAQMWKLILQNPSKFYERLLKDISTHDKTQIEIVLKILSETSSVADDFLKSNVLENLESAAESQKSLSHIFFAGLFKTNLIDRKEFMRDVLMNNLVKAMANEKLNVIAMLLNTLRQISGKLKIEDLLAPLTILLAQILDKYRWDLMNFSQLREMIVENSIDIIQDLVRTVLIHGSKKDKDWIIAKTGNCKVMTKFYYQKLHLEKGEPIVTFDKFLQPEGFEGASKSKITSFLCETIVRCTTKEFKWIMANENIQPFITDTLLVITVIAGKANQQGVTNCLHKCVSDYVKVLKVSLICFFVRRFDANFCFCFKLIRTSFQHQLKRINKKHSFETF